MKLIKCSKCEGQGYTNVPNGPEDVDMETCLACEGSGYVEEIPF